MQMITMQSEELKASTKVSLYHPITIANYFLDKGMYEGIEITPMKLIKLVYIAHGWHRALASSNLITEQAQAWKYGPVLPSIYEAFRKYGKNSITNLEFSNDRQFREFEKLNRDHETIEFLERVWNVYKNYSALELSALTHKEGTPWHTTWAIQEGRNKKSALIPNSIIEAYYKDKIVHGMPVTNSKN